MTSTPLVTKEFVEEHSKLASFETYDYENHPYKDYTLEQLKGRFSYELDESEANTSLLTNTEELTKLRSLQGIPIYFNTLENWVNCPSKIYDQEKCGSCWAFAATGVLSDRFCIQSQGQIKVDLSPQDMVQCDRGQGQQGCIGGMPIPSWSYLQYRGVPTAGCVPYVSGQGQIPQCPVWKTNCADGSQYKRYFAKGWYRYRTLIEVFTDVITKGPFAAGFQMYEDFLNYKGGIYVRKSNQRVGGHMIKVVGWGEENGVDYWICQNTNGPNWAEKGFMRIKFGEASFETEMITGDPRLR